MLVLVNLDSARSRRERMLTQLGDLPHERIGIDGRHLGANRLDRLARELFPQLSFDHDRLSGAEAGCWLSHLSAWRGLLDRPQLPACAMIEDDLRLHPRFGELTAALVSRPQRELVFLGTSSRNLSSRGSTALADGFVLARPVGAIFNTWGYVIRRDACARIVERLDQIAWPIDHVLGGRITRLAPERAVIVPALVDEDPESGHRSQIEPHTFRLDRARWIEHARRRLLQSVVGDLYAHLHRWL